ncbi:LysM peptidoglycan-binding domain-containing protein [Roseospirillum parvum]|uniref:LysM domain-containing protein n=1 Tax=Roseospirillum parvum TaxID=83401 RepID=A0A1G7U366_9PROT|nr:LysM peptidoglycan-binding domain-containing protein [Roseospirillum parvum]SDG42062.1 hypothetical protein SAMN05421742_101195 [Roseospirillum parvum]
MPAPRRGPWPYVCLALLLLLGGLAAGAGVMLEARDEVIRAMATRAEEMRQRTADLKAEVDRLADENARLAREVETHLATIASLNADLDDSFAPEPVGSPVDFPILRGMARQGDTVAAFARREKTTPDVLIALNPWLVETDHLEHRQLIWIPKHDPLAAAAN